MADDSSEDEGVGAQAPPLTAEIAGILRRYPDGGQILKELIQNADDAGASEVRFLVDSRDHTSSGHTFYEDFAKYQGPALYAWNDALFKQNDWAALAKINQSSKKEDVLKVGRFGLGFISVFHLTDLPLVVSGKYMAFIDPHRTTVRKSENLPAGARKRLSKVFNCPGDAALFDGVFGCNKSSDNYNATLFRFPLRHRNSQSKISQIINTVEDIKSTHFESLKCEASFLLLFLNNVKKISLYDMDASSSITRTFSVSINLSDSINFRQYLQQQKVPSKPFVHLNCVSVSSHDDITSESRESFWLVMNLVGTDDKEVNKLSKELATLPWVGLAAEMPQPINVQNASRKVFSHDMVQSLLSEPVELSWKGNHPVNVGGLAFCFLPLPIHTALPIHIHGYFSVTDNRRGIKWPSHDEKSQDAVWNRALIHKMVAPAYATLLSSVCALTRFSPVQLTDLSDDMLAVPYSLWPSYHEIKNHQMSCELLGPTLSHVAQSNILWTTASGGKWVSFKEAYFVPSGCPNVVVSTLLAANLPVVLLPASVRETIAHLTSLATVLKSRVITPSLLRKNFPLGITLTSCDVHSLLQYALSDINGTNFKELFNIPLLPLQNGSQCTFMPPSSSNIVYLLSASLKRYYPDILPGISHLLIDTALPPALEKLVFNIASKGYTQIKVADAKDIHALLKASLSTWMPQDHKWIPGQHGHPPKNWLEMVWKWLREENALNSIEGLPLVPQKCKPGIAYFNLIKLDRTTHFFCFRAPDPAMYSMFEKLNIIAIEEDIIGRVFQDLTCDTVLEVISRHNFITIISAMTPCEKGLLRSFFSSLMFNSKYKACLINLPLFAVTSTKPYFVALSSSCGPFLPPVNIMWPEALKCPTGMLCNQDQLAVRLIQHLGTKPVSFHDFCIDKLVPLARSLISNPGSQKEGDKIILWMLNQTIPGTTLKRLQEEELVRTKAGTYCRARDLYNINDPDTHDQLKVLLNELYLFSIIPDDQYQPYLHWLQRMGLRSWKDIKSNRKDLMAILSKSIQSIAGLSAKDMVLQRGQYILDAMFHRSVLKKEDKVALAELQFLCPLTRPSYYPSSLKWHMTRPANQLPAGCELYSMKTLYYLEDKMPNLVGAVQPIISDYYQVKGEACCFFKPLSANDLLEQLHCIESSQLQVNDQITGMVEDIYKKLSRLKITDKLKAVWCPFMSPPKFIPCGKFVVNTPFDLEPYVYRLPHKYSQYRNLWDIAGTISVADVSRILSDVKKSIDRSKRPLTESEAKMCTSIVCWLYEQKANCDVLFPTVDGQLRRAQDCVYDDRGWTKLSSFTTSVRCSYVDSERIAPAIAKYFHVQPLSLAVAPSSNLAIEYTKFGQHESITNRIARIVEDYNDDVDIFKELLQNADDAQATEVKFLIDWRTHPDSSLFCEEMKPWQGPALLAYNNSIFSAEDLENICKVAGETKLRDPMKTGRFGLGFCATYHMTDLPSFVTGKYLLIFDPHTDYLGARVSSAKPGMQIDIVRTKSDLKIYQDQFAPYNDLFSCNIFNLPESGYSGTLFRFPFRNAVTSTHSKICRKVYGQDEMKSLVDNLTRNSQDLILFQKFIKQITLYEIKEDSSTMTEIFSVRRESTQAQQRINLLQKASRPSDTPLQCSSTCTVHTTQDNKSSKSVWIVSSVLNLNQQSGKLLQTSKAGVLPFGEIALQVEGEGIGKQPQSVHGRMFCFLPLPIYNGLHFHINGHFLVSKDRRSLSLADDSSFGTKWNMFLSSSVCNHGFVSVLEAYIADVRINAHSYKERVKFLKSYYQLWQFHVSMSASIAPSVVESIKQLLRSTRLRLLWTESHKGRWIAVEDAVLFVDNVWDTEVMSDVQSVFLELNYNLVQVPPHVSAVIRDKVQSAGHVYDYKRFISEVLFPQVCREKFLPEWTRNLKYILTQIPVYSTPHNNFEWAEKLLKSRPCIPCQQSSTFMNICDLIDCTNPVVEHLYDVSEGKFPIQELVTSPGAKSSLIKLGMSSSRLTTEQLVDRAKSVQKRPLDSALDRSRKLVHYIKKAYSFRDFRDIEAELKCISKIPFLPVCKKPADLALPWFNEASNFGCPAETYEERKSALVFSVSKVMSACNGDLPFKVLQNPSPELVMQHWKNLIEATQLKKPNKPTIDYLNKVMQVLYSYFNDILHRPNTKVKVNFSMILTPIWQDDMFRPVDKLVWTGQITCYPYMAPVSQQYQEFETLFCRVLGVRKELDTPTRKKLLCDVQQDFQANGVPKHVLSFVIQLVSDLEPSNIGSGCRLFLPDDNCVMRPVEQLACDNFKNEWIKSLPSYQEHFDSGHGYFVHPNIPRERAICLGVRPLLDAVIQEMEDDAFLEGQDFGQHEDLCVRLNGILKKYPADASILQEFIQNADDAQASEIVFILDHRTNHPDKALLCGNEGWRRLHHTPALCIVNNRSFTEKDIKGISDLGRGAKTESLQKIGKFGIGFNVSYHVTDCPSFLSCGENAIPENLCVFDPTMSFVHKRGKTLPGRRWKLSAKHITDFGDQFQPYLLQDIGSRILPSANKTGCAIFRLPLTRISSTDTHKLINGEKFTPEAIKKLFKVFEQSSKEVLLFLSNIRSVSAFEIQRDGRITHCFTTSGVVPSVYTDQCIRFQAQSIQCIAQLKAKQPFKLQSLSVFHRLDIVQKIGDTPPSTESWLVQKVTCGNFTLKELQQAHEHSLRPVGGVAALLRPAKQVNHKLFCYLPMPLVTRLPVHVNGHFTVDDSRKHLESTHILGADWNFSLVKNVIAPAYAQLIVSAKKYCTESQQDFLVDEYLYQLFPKVKAKESSMNLSFPAISGRKDLFDFIAESFYLQMKSCHSDLPVMLVRREPTLWILVKEAVFYLSSLQTGNIIIHVPKILIEVFLTLGLNIVDCPHIYEGFRDSRCYCKLLTQQLVRSHLSSVDLQKDAIKTTIKEHLQCLLDFCIQGERNKHVAHSVPLLLFADGSLQKCSKAFPYQFSSLLPNCLKYIVDEKLGSSAVGRRLTDCGVIAPPPLDFIARNIDLPNSTTPIKLDPDKVKLVSLLWSQVLSTIVGSTNLVKTLNSKPIIPAANGKMYPISLSKSVIGNADKVVRDLLLKFGYSEIDLKVIGLDTSRDHMKFIVETLTFSKSSDYLPCFGLGPPPNCSVELDNNEVNLLVRSLCAFSAKDLKSISGVLSRLKIFKHANDRKYVSVHGSIVQIVPPELPKYGLDIIQSAVSSATFLASPAPSVMILYESVIPNLKATYVTLETMYLQYIIPNFCTMRESQLLVHFDYIKNITSLRSAQQILKKLQQTPLISCDGKLVCAKELFDPRVKFFTKFRRDDLPGRSWRENDRLSFLCKLGLRSTVTTDEWLHQAEKFSRHCDCQSDYKDLSSTLLDQLWTIISDNHLSDQNLSSFLAKVSEISFMLNPTSFYHFIMAEKALKFKVSSDLYVKFRQSVSCRDVPLAFCMCSALPEECDKFIRNSKIRAALGIQSPIGVSMVIEHFKRICDAAKSLSLPVQGKESSTFVWLDKIIDSHYKFFNEVKLKPEESASLKDMACFLVGSGAVRKMVKPNQVVEMLPSKCDLEPYIYNLPHHIAQYARFTAALQVKKELMAEDCGRVLKSIDGPLSGNEALCKVAECAYDELIRCLRHGRSNFSDQDRYDGVLLTEDYELHHIRDLFYNDVPWFTKRAQSCKFKYIKEPLADGQGRRVPPRSLGVKFLSEVVKEKLHKKCRSRDALCNIDILHNQQKRSDRCVFPARIEATLRSQGFYEGMLRVYFADYNCKPPESFCSSVLTFKDFEIVCLSVQLTTVLSYNAEDIAGSEESSQCCTLNTDEKILFIHPHSPDFKIDKLMKNLSSQLNLALGNVIKNEQNIGLLFACEPAHIKLYLTNNRVPDYSTKQAMSSESFCAVGSSRAISILSPLDALIVVNFRRGEKVWYYSPSGQLIYAEVVKSHNSLHSNKLTSSCIEITTVKLEKESVKDIGLHSILVSPLELFKILTSSQKKGLRDNTPSLFASPLVLPDIPCDSTARIKLWCREIYRSEDVLMFSGLLVSLIKIRLIAQLHYCLLTGRMTPQVFKTAIFEIMQLAANENLPFTPVIDSSGLGTQLKSISRAMKQLSLADHESEDGPSSDQEEHSNSDTDLVDSLLVVPRRKPRDSFAPNSSDEDDDLPMISQSAGNDTYSPSSDSCSAIMQSSSRQKHSSSPSSGSHKARRSSTQVKSRNDFGRYQSSPVSNSLPALSQSSSKASSSHQPQPTITPATIGTAHSRFSARQQNTSQKSRFETPTVKKPPICKEKATAWLEQAKADYTAAQDLLQVIRSKDSTKCHLPALVCSLCHDTMEKCLKGLLYFYGGEIYQHDLNCTNLVTLLTQFKSKASEMKEFHEVCNHSIMVVSMYDKKSRYPHLHNPTCAPAAVYLQQDAEEAFGAIADFMKKLIAEPLLNSTIGDLNIVPRPKFISSMKSSTAQSPYPDNWDEMKEDEEVGLFLLDPDPDAESDEYDRVKGQFNCTLPQRKVNKIYRIQNKHLWTNYYDHSRRMLDVNNGVLREELLFHGTRQNDPKLIYRGTDGFDMRHSNAGVWGRGNYFAANASYSDSYAYQKDGLRKMFAAWVLTGITCDSAPDSSLIKPPVRNRDAAESQVKHHYDTVTGMTGGTRVYITYDNRHAYPAYLIVYQ